VFYFLHETLKSVANICCPHKTRNCEYKLLRIHRASCYRLCVVINPFITSGTYMSHLQMVFSSLQEYQYPTSSPCCHLPWNISTLWNQSEYIFPRNNRVHTLLCAMLRGRRTVFVYFSRFWVYFIEISVVGAFIFSALLFVMHLSETFFILRRIERYMIKNVFWSYVKCPLLLSDFN
jgi:hypothetical protein